jgi:hypothetical protein
MTDHDLKKIIERLAAQVANDLKTLGSHVVANVTMRDAPAVCSEMVLDTVNPLEQTSLKALISWASANSNMSEQQVALCLAERFHVSSLDGISHEDFDDAVSWLVDFRPVLN